MSLSELIPKQWIIAERAGSSLLIFRRMTPMAAAALAMILQRGCPERSATTKDTSALVYEGAAPVSDLSCRVVEYSPDRQLLAAGGSPLQFRAHAVRLWDFAVLEELAILPSLGSRIAAVNSDGWSFVTGSWFGDVSVWDMSTGDRIDTVRGVGRPAHSAKLCRTNDCHSTIFHEQLSRQ